MIHYDDTAFNIEVGRRLRAARLSLGWSQTQLARLLGLTFQQVQKYETGRNRLPASRIPIIKSALPFEISDLITTTQADDAANEPHVAEIASLMRSLAPNKIELLLQYARCLTREPNAE